FKNKFNFIKCIFHEKIDFSYSFFSTTCIEENVSFKECTFKFNVFFNETRFETHVNFEESTFEKQVIFNNAFFLNQETEINYIEVSFLGAIFKDRAYFYNITFKSMIDFSYAIFENEVRFCNTYFESVVHFSFTKFKGVCDFSNTKFLATQKKEERNRICFDDTEFEDIVHFYSAKFESKVLFCKSVFKSKVNFNGAEFSTSHYDDAEINNFDNVTFESDAWFDDIIFNSSVLFSKCEYKGNIYMRNITSKQQLYFYESLFLSNVYFNNSHFKDYVSFCECEFEKTACFYGVKFDKTPNFSQAIFKGNLNVVNTNLNFTFDDLQERIKQEYEDFNKNIENKKPLDKFANDFRDSFRIFKSALIKDNNLLDASNFHKYELYCKEIELKNKKGKTFKDVVDRWQLLFYRKLCDHHTNLILNLKWFIVIVGFFTSILFGLRYGDGNLMQFFNKDSDLLKMLKNILNIKALNDSNATYLILLYSFIGLFFVRTFFIFYYLVIFILMLAISPYNLFTMINFAIRHETNSFLENIIIIIYTLSIVLIIFSLQKTARKNSIVPS
ncbi:pentapeptide repeat-containing protein, partial [Campylobacter jejuni]|nr:pentapeptide repeat-containing protein [Campylobacter jejuni]